MAFSASAVKLPTLAGAWKVAQMAEQSRTRFVTGSSPVLPLEEVVVVEKKLTVEEVIVEFLFENTSTREEVVANGIALINALKSFLIVMAYGTDNSGLFTGQFLEHILKKDILPERPRVNVWEALEPKRQTKPKTNALKASIGDILKAKQIDR